MEAFKNENYVSQIFEKISEQMSIHSIVNRSACISVKASGRIDVIFKTTLPSNDFLGRLKILHFLLNFPKFYFPLKLFS